MSDEDFDAIVASVKRDGLREDILLTHDGQLLDGRHRLAACYESQVEPRFKLLSEDVDPWETTAILNILRRHLSVGQRSAFCGAWVAAERNKARQRMIDGGKAGGKVGGRGNRKREEKGKVTLPYPFSCKQSRDIVGEKVGVSGSSIDKFMSLSSDAPDLADKVRDGSITLEAGYKELRQRAPSKPQEKPQRQTEAEAEIVTAAGVRSTIKLPAKVVFNKTTDAVDWASWTWNPVTGCEHGCEFCYARAIAHSERMAPYYPNKFEPTFHEYRLAAPANTTIPKSSDPTDGRVFVCSMADLFGKWVPVEWIRKVFDACLATPEWEYLFLTKWPARYSQMPLIENAWYGASVIQQSDVSRIETAMQKIESDKVVKWISLEPMLGPVTFNDLSWCNLVVIGAQTSTSQPTGPVGSFSPKFDWIVNVINQCREADVPYYLKANLLQDPGMQLPKAWPKR